MPKKTVPKSLTKKPIKEHIRMVEEKRIITCLCCGSKNQRNFYMSHNNFNKFFAFIPYCKTCIKTTMWDFYMKKYNSKECLALHALLRALNLPYIHGLYLASVKNMSNPNATIKSLDNELDEEDNGSVLVSAYMKNYNSLHTKNGYGDSYDDSEGVGEVSGLTSYEDVIKIKRKRKAVDTSKIDTSKYDLIECDVDDLIQKWGLFEDEDLIYLEGEYLDWKDKIGDYINEKATELMVKQVCLQTLEIYQKRQLGAKVKDDVTTLQSLLTNSGLLEKQQQKSSEDIKIGMTIADIENTRPLKETLPELVDIDKYGEVIDTFTGAMCRTLGKENYFTKKFDDLYKNYTIDLINTSITDTIEESIEDGEESG